MFNQFRQNLNKYDRAILIIRNPLDAFIATMNLWITESHVEHGTYDQWEEIDMQDHYLNKFLIYWNKFHEEILDHYLVSNEPANNKLHMVEYSELKYDLIGEVKKIVKFLGLPMMTKYIKECILKNPDGYHKRPNYFSWTNYLIQMGKIDQSVIQSSKMLYEEFVQKFEQKLIKM